MPDIFSEHRFIILYYDGGICAHTLSNRTDLVKCAITLKSREFHTMPAVDRAYFFQIIREHLDLLEEGWKDR